MMQPNKLIALATITLMLFMGGSSDAKDTQAVTRKRLESPKAKTVAEGFIWHPETSPSGPVVVIINLAEQILYVYRNGVRMGQSTISSGKAGHRTPTGVFTILEKNKTHTSSLYKGASMPFMERLTWQGVALHAGNLPGYPASHGCIRLPLEFAQKLYSITSKGTTVIITDQKSTPGVTSTPGLLFDASSNRDASTDAVIWTPEKSAKGPVSIIISSFDKIAYIFRDGMEIGRASIEGLCNVKGTYIYSALMSIDSESRHDWLDTTGTGKRGPNLKAIIERTRVDPAFLKGVRSLIIAGTTLVLTNEAVSVSSRSGIGYSILTTMKR